MEEMEAKFCSSDKEEAFKRELPYCIGEIDFTASGKKRGKFIKVPSTIHPGIIFEVMLNKWKLPAPNLVVSLVGEEENFQMKPWLRDTLKKGLIKAAQSTGAWIFTSALRVGITRHLVQAVRDHALASTSSKVRVIAIGITSLRKTQHREILDNTKSKPKTPAMQDYVSLLGAPGTSQLRSKQSKLLGKENQPTNQKIPTN